MKVLSLQHFATVSLDDMYIPLSETFGCSKRMLVNAHRT